jgi:DNA-directed RNA polymerase specialized sigma24 family protein
MAKPKTDGERLVEAIENLNTRLEDIFILQAARAGISQQKIRAILGIDLARVTRVARHVKGENRGSNAT